MYRQPLTRFQQFFGIFSLHLQYDMCKIFRKISKSYRVTSNIFITIFTRNAISSYNIKFFSFIPVYSCALTGHSLQLFSNLCPDVYGTRNLIVQMGRKDDVVPGQGRSRAVCLSQLFLLPRRSSRVFLLRTFRRCKILNPRN